MKTLQAYDAAHEEERVRSYPMITEYEQRVGFAIDRHFLESCARELACPLKVNPPNWQHGRVIYSTLRRILASDKRRAPSGLLLDIGTAKGFSACVMGRACFDAGRRDRQVMSIDVIDPYARVLRNSVAELEAGRALTVPELTACWRPIGGPELTWLGIKSSDYLHQLVIDGPRIQFAFVDGKHTYESVKCDVSLIRELQAPGDCIVFDDLQMEGVAQAVNELGAWYAIEYLAAKPERQYAVAWKC